MRKITLEFSDQAWDTIVAMAEELPSSRSDVLRDALSLYWWAFRESKEGHRLALQRGREIVEILQPRLDALRERYQAQRSA